MNYETRHKLGIYVFFAGFAGAHYVWYKIRNNPEYVPAEQRHEFIFPGIFKLIKSKYLQFTSKEQQLEQQPTAKPEPSSQPVAFQSSRRNH